MFVNEVQTAVANINILRPQNLIENSHNMRTFEIPALGGVLLSNFTEEQATYFEPGKEILFYNNYSELKDEIIFLQRNRSVLEDISKRAYERSIKSDYSYDARSREMLRIFNSRIR